MDIPWLEITAALGALVGQHWKATSAGEHLTPAGRGPRLYGVKLLRRRIPSRRTIEFNVEGWHGMARPAWWRYKHQNSCDQSVGRWRYLYDSINWHLDSVNLLAACWLDHPHLSATSCAKARCSTDSGCNQHSASNYYLTNV